MRRKGVRVWSGNGERERKREGRGRGWGWAAVVDVKESKKEGKEIEGEERKRSNKSGGC